MKKFLSVAFAIVCTILVGALATEEKRHGHKLIGVTAQCKDGMFTTARKSQGACSGHGGVKYWIEQGVRE